MPTLTESPTSQHTLSPEVAQTMVKRRWPWLLAALLMSAVLFVVTVLAWLWYIDQRNTAARELSLDLTWLEQTVTQGLEDNQRVVASWTHDLQSPDPAKLSEFLGLSDGLMKENPAMIGIDVLDKSAHRIAGLPNYTERPRRLPPISDPLITDAIQRCIATKSPSYSRVIEQFAPLWVVVIPTSDEAPSQGVVLMTYDLDQLLTSEVPWWFVQRYDLSLVDRDNKRLSPHDAESPAVSEDLHKLNFGPDNSGLSLQAARRDNGHSELLLIGLSAAIGVAAILILWLLRILQRWLRERLASQQALASSREQMYAVLSGLDAAVYVSKISDGTLLFRNRQHSDLFLFDAEGDCCLMGWLGLSPEADRETLDYQDRVTGHWYHLERRKIVWVDNSLVVLDIATDITLQREADNTARERDELLQHTARLANLAEFASGIAHELNQPLAAITNYSAVASAYLESEPLQTDKIRRAVEQMSEESHRAGKIIQSLRSFIQKRAIHHDLHKLEDLLQVPLQQLEPMAQRLGTNIAVQILDHSIQLECDAVMIEQVLFNLIRNGLESYAAIERSDYPDAVLVHVSRQDRDVVVSVSDRGPGIQDPSKLFSPFYTTKSGGMGLGLAICRTVVESHGGRLWAEANPEGGACFKFKMNCVM